MLLCDESIRRLHSHQHTTADLNRIIAPLFNGEVGLSRSKGETLMFPISFQRVPKHAQPLLKHSASGALIEVPVKLFSAMARIFAGWL